MSSQPNPAPILDSFFDSYDARRESARTLLGFSLVYLSGYFTDPPALFHPELVRSLENEALKRLLVIGFRGSGKSTFGSLALPLWAALEHPDKYPFILLVADSSRQATLNISAIKYELETNTLIKQDYGEIKGNVIEDFALKGEGEEWQKQNIVLSNGVRILARSRGQKVRGLRHLQHRPKLVIVDDPEDGEWVRTKENRDKTDRWLHSEVMPGMDARKGKLVVIGNLLHMDALLSRLKAPGTGFKVLEFPLIDKDGVCTWPAMYPTEQSLKDKERDMGAIPWQREMLLKIVSDDEAIITPEDIHYYDEIPPKSESTNDKGEKVRIPILASLKGHGVDLAISEKESADYTAIVSGDVYYIDDGPKIYVRANPYNQHVNFHETMKHVRGIPGERGGANIFFVEDIGYQKAAVQEMERAMLPVVPMKPTTDKRSRLQVVAPYIKNGTVLFPRAGCEELLGQIFNLGVDSHDDLCLAADTRVVTERGNIAISEVRIGDRVMTRLGFKTVLWSGKTGHKATIERFGLRGTPNHPVITKRGVIPLTKLNPSDIVYIWSQSRSCTEEKSIGEIRTQNAEPTASTFGATTNGRKPLIRFIEICGSMLMAPFRRAWSFITRMAIRCITSFPTLSLSPAAGIWPIICVTRSASNSQGETCSPSFMTPHGNGTVLQKDASGTASTQRDSSLIASSRRSSAKTAESYFNTNTTRPASVHTDAGIRAKEPVYNLLVEDAHEFFANDLLVHNCDGLVWLLQGLVNQGLELPKIHWIEA